MALAASCTCGALGLRHSLPAVHPDPRRPATARRQRLAAHASVARGPPSGDDGSDDLTARFAKELEKRDLASAAAAEVEHAIQFDGSALLQVIQDRYLADVPIHAQD